MATLVTTTLLEGPVMSTARNLAVRPIQDFFTCEQKEPRPFSVITAPDSGGGDGDLSPEKINFPVSL